MPESIAVNRTVAQRGQKVFTGFVRSSDSEWLCVAPTRSGERYVAIPTGSVRSVDTSDDDGPVRIAIDASALVYDVLERARPATDIEPWPDDEPDVAHMQINPFNQLALLMQLQMSGGSLVIGDVDEETLNAIIAALLAWKRRNPWWH